MSTPFFSNLHRFIQQHVPDKINVDQLHGMTSRFSPEEKQWTGFNDFTKPPATELTPWKEYNATSMKPISGSSTDDHYHIPHPSFSNEGYKVNITNHNGIYAHLGTKSSLEEAKQLADDHEKSRGIGVGNKIDKSALLAYMASKTPQYKQHILGASVKNELVWFHGKDHSSADSQGGSKFVINHLPDGNPKETPWDLSHMRAPYYHRDPLPHQFATREEAVAAAQKLHDIQKGSVEPTKHKVYTLPGGTNYNEHVFEWQNNPGTKYRKGSHWDQDNPMFHLRTKDRNLVGGGKALHLEELQSDLHQDGRKYGYNTPEGREVVDNWKTRKKEFLDKSRSEYGPIEDQIHQYLKNASQTPFHQRSTDDKLIDHPHNGPHLSEHSYRYLYKPFGHSVLDPLINQANEIRRKHNDEYMSLGPEKQFSGMVPNAPHKGDWKELAFRTAIYNAAKQGKSHLTWSTGEQSAKHYSLEKQVGQVRYENGRLRAWKEKNGEQWGTPVIVNKTIPPYNLDQYLGKELAEKLLQSHNGQMTPEGEKVFELRGDDMKVGSHGMQGFYGSHDPETGAVEHGVMSRVANAYAKKLHGAGAPQSQIYETPIQSAKAAKNEYGHGFTVTAGRGNHSEVLSTHPTLAEAKIAASKAKSGHVFGIQITPEMRERILRGGVPLWGHTDTSMMKALSIYDFHEDDLIKGRRIIIHNGKVVDAEEHPYDPAKKRKRRDWEFLGTPNPDSPVPQYGRNIGGRRTIPMALPAPKVDLGGGGGYYHSDGDGPLNLNRYGGKSPQHTTNSHASNISTIGVKRSDPFVKLLGGTWGGSTIHHISSNLKLVASGSGVTSTPEMVHLVHTLDPEAAAAELKAHLGEGATVVSHGKDEVTHSVTHMVSGVPHRVTFFRGRTSTPEGSGMVLKSNTPSTTTRSYVIIHSKLVPPDTSQDLLKGIADEHYNSPLYEALSGGPFGSGEGSAWLWPDGSHEKVRTHASSLSGTGMTMSDYQRKTGKVRVGMDRRGAYVGVVGHVTPEQHRVANEFLRAAMFRDKTPSWERTDPDMPGHFEYKESTLPARLIQKALDGDDFDVIKASRTKKPPADPDAWTVPTQYQLPPGMEENSPEHSAHIKQMSFSEADPHPEMRSKPFEYKVVRDAYNAIPGLREQFGYTPQNLWHSDEALLGMMRKGENGKHWYTQFHDGLKVLAKSTDISPRRLLSVFALNGQAAGLKENASATLKEFSRHRAGLYDDPNEAQMHKELGIMKAPSGKPALLATTLDLLRGGDIVSKKLKAYAHSFHDMLSNPAIDMWIQRAMVGGGHGNSPDTVSKHVTKAATGRINYLRDLWNKRNPKDQLRASQVQAMLWYGMKHSAADHLDSIADHLEAHHPEYNTAQLRETSKKIRYDGSFDSMGEELGLKDAGGLPLSSTHMMMKNLAPHIKDIYDKDLARTDHYNWHEVTSDNTPQELKSALDYLHAHHSSYKQRIKMKTDAETGQTFISAPKRGRDGVVTLLGHKGVTINPVKTKEGASYTTTDTEGLKAHLMANPELREQLGILHSTIKYHEKHPHSTLIGDIGHGTAEIAKIAHGTYGRKEKPTPIFQPIIYGAYRNHPDYNDPPQVSDNS